MDEEIRTPSEIISEAIRIITEPSSPHTYVVGRRTENNCPYLGEVTIQGVMVLPKWVHPFWRFTPAFDEAKKVFDELEAQDQATGLSCTPMS